MAYTLAGIADKVRYRIKDQGYSSTEIRNYINDTINDIFNEYRLRFMETSQTYTLATNATDITNGSGLPTNFVQAISLNLTTSGTEKQLDYIDYNELDQRYPDPADTSVNPAGIPRYWYLYGNTIRVFPAPASDYQLTMRYYKRPTELANDSDVPELPSEFEEILVVGASFRVMQVKDNYDKAAILENKYGELLEKLVARYSQAQTGQATRMRINRYALGEQI